MENIMEMKQNAKMSLPGWLLRVEGAAVFSGSVAVYAAQDFSWLWFALLFFLPDIALFVYLVNQQTGRTVYNLLHTITVPLLLVLLGYATGVPALLQIGLIWLAHIGLDRTIGYGLKLDSEFKETHLQRV